LNENIEADKRAITNNELLLIVDSQRSPPVRSQVTPPAVDNFNP
jgi:hypothetical protein